MFMDITYARKTKIKFIAMAVALVLATLAPVAVMAAGSLL